MDNYTLFSYINVKNLFKYFNIRYKNYRTHKLIISIQIVKSTNNEVLIKLIKYQFRIINDFIL